jgi:hypothetical protein
MIAFAINGFGDGEHPIAAADNLEYFTACYKRHCLQLMIDRAKECLERLKVK